MIDLTEPPSFTTTLLPAPQIVSTVETPAAIETELEVGQGPAGRPGRDGVGDSHYVHDQMTASDTWTVTHGLGKYPSVTVVDSAGSVVEGSIDFVSMNELTLSFSAGFAGRAFLN